jgi:hypothetical protein
MGQMASKAETIPPVTMGHIRGHGCRDLLVYCGSGHCHHSATMKGDGFPDDLPVRSTLRPDGLHRTRCDRCRRPAGLVAAYPAHPLPCRCLHGRPPVRYSGCGAASLGPPTPARLLSDLLVWAVPGTAAASHLRFLCTEQRASAHGRVGVSWKRFDEAAY